MLPRVLGIALLNFIIAYIISRYSFVIATGWFCFAIGFQYGKWYGGNKKEEEFIAREEVIR